MGRAVQDAILETRNLTKRYGDRLAVDDLNLALFPGEIFGFLGPNGAGKTTTIRMILNLVRPTAGEVRLFGRRLRNDPSGLLQRVGALIESPSFQPYLTGRQNLRVAGQYTGPVSPARVDEVLELVGLWSRADDAFAAYSLGMKQRLGIGAAVLMNPDLVLLDEPTNGLDPAGIVEIRELILRLGRNGTAVLVSSHLLAEIRQVATRIGIIRAGRLIAGGDTREIVRRSSHWEVLGLDLASVQKALAGVAPPGSIQAGRQGIAILDAGLEGRVIIERLARAELFPDEVRRSSDDLENVFLTLTEREAGL